MDVEYFVYLNYYLLYLMLIIELDYKLMVDLEILKIAPIKYYICIILRYYFVIYNLK